MMELAKTPEAAFWSNEIATYESQFAKWEVRAKKIVKRYKDERPENAKRTSQFNILWSNIQTLGPALYAKNPTPNVDRRFQDDDKLGTVSAMVLERAVTYFVEQDLFGDVMRSVVQDRLLPGRGTAWVRYVPNFRDVKVEGTEEVKEDGSQVTDDQDTEEPEQELYSEDVVPDYVHWCDFGHTWGRTWEEVRAIWRKVYLTRKQLKKRGFKDWQSIPLDYTPKKSDDKSADVGKKATVYEIWDKETRKVYWIHKEWPDALDIRPDPLGLKDFFPCPKPLFATLANDNLIPTPDYIQYQDQARELDDLTARIASITKAIKVVGVYDKSAEGVQRILGENLENTLVPIENWAVFGEKGGLKGVIDYFPVADLAKVLMSLYDARDRTKQDLYEVTGISDIIRGATDPNETLGAQQLKGQFATLRLDYMQGDVARFSRDIVRIFGEIIAEHFSLDTIKDISSIKLLTMQEKQQIQMQQQMAPQGGQPQPLPEEIQKLLDEPTWEEVMTLLRNDTMRCFKITIETDSTIKADQEAEKQARVEFLGAAGGFIEKAVMMPPDLQPLAMEMLQFGIKGFKVGREMETTFDVALKKIKEATEQPQPEKADPEIEKVKMQGQLEQQKLQGQQQSDQMKMQQQSQSEQQKLQYQAQSDAQAAQLEMRKEEMRIQANLQIEKNKANVQIQMKQMELAQERELELLRIASSERVAIQTKPQETNDAD